LTILSTIALNNTKMLTNWVTRLENDKWDFRNDEINTQKKTSYRPWIQTRWVEIRMSE